MNQRCRMLCWQGARALLLVMAVVAGAPLLRAEGDDDDSYMGESPVRYAQVKVLEGDVQILKGESQEALERGTPVAEGDVVESHGRGVLQLGDGSRLAFGRGTRFQVAALFMDQNSEQEVLIRLDYGRLRAVLGASSNAKLRIDTPSGTAVIGDRCNASFEIASDQVTRIRVHTGRLWFSNEDHRATLRAGERMTIYSKHDQLDRVRSFNTYENDEFDTWCEGQLNLRRGESYSHVPEEIRYYADDLDGHGEWIYMNDYDSWCWRPSGVAVDWRPYWNGRWGSYPGGMTWVSYDPWGYVTHHYGRWGWRSEFGWYWIPGVYFAPAWVAWQHSDAYFGWAPLGYQNTPCSWGYGNWGGGHCWNIVDIHLVNDRHLHRRMHHDPTILRRFNPIPGLHGTPGHRPLTPPWRRGPLLVNRREFQNPVAMRPLLQDRVTQRQRLQDYERRALSTGRTVFRRETPAVPRPNLVPGASAPMTPRASFEDRARLRPVNRPPAVFVPRSEPANPNPRPQVDGPARGGTSPGGRPNAQPGSQRPDSRPDRERPRMEDRPVPRDTPREERRNPEPNREYRQPEQRPDRPASPPPTARPSERPSTPPPTVRQPDRPSSPPPAARQPDRPSTPPPTVRQPDRPSSPPPSGRSEAPHSQRPSQR
jgi:hypothetical protein